MLKIAIAPNVQNPLFLTQAGRQAVRRDIQIGSPPSGSFFVMNALAAVIAGYGLRLLDATRRLFSSAGGCMFSIPTRSACSAPLAVLHRMLGRMLLGIACASALAACTHVPAPPASALQETRYLTGTASFRERIALPPQAVFEATLIDVSRAGAAAQVLGRERVQPVAGPVIPFRIAYDAAAIDPRLRYSVRATITVDNQLWFTTDQAAPVLTQGGAHKATLRMRMVRRTPGVVPATSPAPADLRNTYWRLLTVEDQPITLLPNQREPYMVLSMVNGHPKVRAMLGCNLMGGTYSAQTKRLDIQWTHATTKACVPALSEQEEKVKSLLSRELHWEIDGAQLKLHDGNGRPVAAFEAVYVE